MTISCLLPLGVFLALSVLLVGLINRTKIRRLVAVLLSILAVLASLALALFVILPIANDIEQSEEQKAAQPLVQEVLNEQCGLGRFTADLSGFYYYSFPYGSEDSGMVVGPFLGWHTDDGETVCTYVSDRAGENMSWVCEC